MKFMLIRTKFPNHHHFSLFYIDELWMSLRMNQCNLNRWQQLMCLSFKQAHTEDYGTDWEGPAPSEAWDFPLCNTDESVVISQTSQPFCLETCGTGRSVTQVIPWTTHLLTFCPPSYVFLVWKQTAPKGATK